MLLLYESFHTVFSEGPQELLQEMASHHIMAEITAATGWLPHSARAALARLRRNQPALTRFRSPDEGHSRYRLPPVTSPRAGGLSMVTPDPDPVQAMSAQLAALAELDLLRGADRVRVRVSIRTPVRGRPSSPARSARRSSFNPHPREGATGVGFGARVGDGVSIRTPVRGRRGEPDHLRRCQGVSIRTPVRGRLVRIPPRPRAGCVSIRTPVKGRRGGDGLGRGLLQVSIRTPVKGRPVPDGVGCELVAYQSAPP